MRRLVWIGALLGAMVVTVLAQDIEIDGRPELKLDRQHTQWIQRVIRTIETIKPGTMRKELAPILAEDGGLQFRQQGRFSYTRCPYIKVDIEFSVVDGLPDSVVDEQTGFSPDDKVLRVSRPYLEYPVAD